MKRAISCLVLFSAGLSAQSTAKLDTDLMALSNPNAPLAAIANRVTDDILALADREARPSRQAVLDFSVELSKALIGKIVAETQSSRPVPAVQAASSIILDVLQSSAMSSSRFHQAIDHFRGSLIALNATAIQAKSAADRLMILGQEIRGPEDIRFLQQLQQHR